MGARRVLRTPPALIAVVVVLAGCGSSAPRPAAATATSTQTPTPPMSAGSPPPVQPGAAALACASDGRSLATASVAYVARTGHWPRKIAELVAAGQITSPPPQQPIATKGYYLTMTGTGDAPPTIVGQLTGVAGRGLCYRSHLR